MTTLIDKYVTLRRLIFLFITDYLLYVFALKLINLYTVEL